MSNSLPIDHFVRRAAVALAIAFSVAPSMAQDQAPAPLAQDMSVQYELTKELGIAMSAFQAGDYATAAAKLEGIIAKAGEGAQLESIYFTLGASYFNLGQYDKAVETLKTLQSKYPKGAHLADATFSIAQASLFAKNFDEAAAQFARLENLPQFREQALFFGASALEQSGHVDQAIKKFEALISPEIRTSVAVNGAMRLAGLYGKKKQPEKAMALIEKILQKPELVENLVRLNAMAVELGDDHLETGRPADALNVYRMVRSREDVIKFQADREDALQKKLDETLAAIRSDPKGATQLLGKLQQQRDDIAEAKKLHEDAKQLPDFTPALDLRLGRCYYDLGKRWESIVAYGGILELQPPAKERETALFASIVDYAELNRPESAHQLGEQYLKEFSQGANTNTVGYLMGTTALQANDPQGAETYFGRMLKEQPASTFAEEMRFLLGNAKFAQGKFEEAIKDYEQYRKDYPKGAHAEEVDYRIAVSLVFAGQYEKAMSALDSYLQKYPKGVFAPDARYRLAVCLYAAQQYDDVIGKCQAWEKDYGKDQQLGEVLALQGDALMAQGKTDEAIATYIRSYKVSTTSEVLSYSLFEAQKGLQKKGDWAGISALFEEFVKQRPEDPAVPMAMYWIGKARAREGKVDEAKQFTADTIKKYIDDPKRDAVEQLLTQLAQLCTRRKLPPPPPVEPTPSTASPAASPAVALASPSPQPAIDPSMELDALLADAGKSPLAKARILYAKAELARLRKKADDQNKQLNAIARNFAPGDLSPMLLAQAGDYLLSIGELDKAAVFYQQLMDAYPKSDVADFAYNGLGEIVYRKGDYPKALHYFDDAIEKAAAAQKLKDVTVGRAKTLLALNRLDEAQKSFEQVASVREWRGEATAFAMYSLGEIEFKRGKWAEANAIFQRVFVAYQKFLPWVAKAYIQSAVCFEKLGKTPEAIRTYQEMLRNEKLASFAEMATARKRLQALQGGTTG